MTLLFSGLFLRTIRAKPPDGGRAGPPRLLSLLPMWSHSPALEAAHRRLARARLVAAIVAVTVAVSGGLAGCTAAHPHHASAPVAGHPRNMSAYDDTVRVEASTTCAAAGSSAASGGEASGGASSGATSGAGTGLTIGEGLTDGRFVLTTASVVAGAHSATVTNRLGQRVPARLVTVDPEANVAWLYAPGLPSRPTSPATAADHVAPAYVFAVGERSVSVLRALSLERTTRTGTDVYRGHAVTRQVYVLHLDQPSTADVIGSPVLDEDGHLLGLVLSGATGDKEVVALAGDAVAQSPATGALQHLADPSTAPMPVTRCAS